MGKLPPGVVRGPEYWASLTEAVDRYETAHQARDVAFDRGWEAINAGEMKTMGDAHPAALDYQVADSDLWIASDALVDLIAKGHSVAVKRGNVLYARVSMGRMEDSERHRKGGRGPSELPPDYAGGLRITRFDLGPDNDHVIHMDI